MFTVIRSLNRRYLGLPIYVRLIIAGLAISLFIISTQNIQIFPGAVASIFNSNSRTPAELPKGVENVFINTEDNERIELWRLASKAVSPVVLIFHGNAGDVANFFGYQQYFESLGFTSYGFDYRGYGRSSGWPSEEGLYADGRAVIRHVMDREKISNREILIVGISIGSGAATRTAKEFDVGGILLLSPFASLREAVSAVPLFGIFSPFTFYNFPVAQDIEHLTLDCFIVAHGERDNVIPFEQGRSVFAAYNGKGHTRFISSKEASHNDLLGKVHLEISQSLRNCYTLP